MSHYSGPCSVVCCLSSESQTALHPKYLRHEESGFRRSPFGKRDNWAFVAQAFLSVPAKNRQTH